MLNLTKPLNNMTRDELIAEWRHWNAQIESMPGWGAAMTAANEFRSDARAMLERKFPEVTIEQLRKVS